MAIPTRTLLPTKLAPEASRAKLVDGGGVEALEPRVGHDLIPQWGR